MTTTDIDPKNGSSEATDATAGDFSRPPCCAFCRKELDEEEIESPMTKEGLTNVICDDCFREKYEDDCDRCGEIVDKDDLEMRPGELIAMWQEVDGLKPGYYRVLRWPIYMDGMIEGYVCTENLEYYAPLDERGEKVAKHSDYPGGRLCCGCRRELDKHNAEMSHHQKPEEKA